MTLLLIDDHALFRDALALLLRQRMPGIRVASAGTLGQAAAALKTHPDTRLVLLDLGLDEQQGLDTLLQWRRIAPRLPVVVVSADDDHATRDAVIKAGALAFVPKRASVEALADALPAWLEAGDAPAADVAGELSARQLEVLRLLVEGCSNKEIGRALALSEATVKTHLVAIFRKLGVESRTQAAVAAQRLGLTAGAESGRQRSAA